MTFAKIEPKKAAPELNEGQIAILRAVHRRNPDGSLLDIYQVMKAVKHTATRQAMSYRLGHLRAHGLIKDGGTERRSNPRPVRLFEITEAGKALIRPMQLPGSTPGGL